MMKKLFFLSVLLLTFGISAFSQKIQVDTIYYDSEWCGVPTKHFASYYRVAEIGQKQQKKRFRDYYITGELYGEGYYLSIDRANDSLSVFEGQCTSFFRSGKKGWKRRYVNGEKQGEAIEFYENGKIKKRTSYKDDKLDGLCTYFSEDGFCMQQEFSLGTPRYNYYTLASDEGLYGKFKINDNSPIFSLVSVSDQKVKTIDNRPWEYYLNDGLCVAATNVETEDYGKYYRIFINITNNSFTPINIDPTEITGNIVDDKGKETAIEIQSAEQYENRIKRTQKWEELLSGLANAWIATSAGYSKTATQSTFSGNYGNFGYNGYSTSTFTSYNSSTAYLAQLAASERVASLSESNYQFRLAKKENYLRKITIRPKESLNAYFNIKRKKGESLTVYLKIEGVTYPFLWVRKKQDKADENHNDEE